MKSIEIQNRRAGHHYSILESIEAGLVLTGPEIKSIRSGGGDLAHSYGRIENGEAWLHSFHIAPYSHGNRANPEPDRPRKLLLYKSIGAYRFYLLLVYAQHIHYQNTTSIDSNNQTYRHQR